jgi:hypothetical protein
MDLPQATRKKDFTLQLPQWVAVQDLLQHALDGERELGLVGPTGWGKSVILTVLLHHLLKVGCESVVVAVPQVAIEGSFEARTKPVHIVPEEMTGSASWVPPLDLSAMWLRLREADGRSRDLFAAHIGPGRPINPALITTHASLAKWINVIRGMDLRGRTLVIDECQHAHDKAASDSGTVLSEFRRLWIAQGGTVIGSTATPTRMNGKPVFGPGAKIHVYTQAEHSAVGNAPSDFQFRMDFFDFEASTQAEVDGDTLPAAAVESGAGHAKIVRTYLADGRPKTIIYVPAGRSREWSEHLIDALAAVHPRDRLFNAVGSGKDLQQRLDDLLQRERARAADSDQGFSTSEVDIIVTCRRLVEGVDWPFCSHLYNVGLGHSYPDILQKLGRATRFKGRIAGYPERFQNVASLTFFVLRAGASMRSKMQKAHHRQALLLTAGLSDFATGNAYWTELVLGGAIQGTGRPKTAREAVDRSRRRQRVVTDAEKRARARARLLTLMSGCSSAMGIDAFCLLVGQDVETADDNRDAIALATTALDKATQDEEIRTYVRQRLENAADEAIASGTDEEVEKNLRAYLRSILADVARRFANHTVAVEEGPVELLSQFTGTDSQEITRDLQRALDDFKPTRERVVDALKTFWREHSRHVEWEKGTGDQERVALPEIGWTWRRVGKYIRDNVEIFFDTSDEHVQYLMTAYGSGGVFRVSAIRWLKELWDTIWMPPTLEESTKLVARYVLMNGCWPRPEAEVDLWTEAPYFRGVPRKTWKALAIQTIGLRKIVHEGACYKGFDALCVLALSDIEPLRPDMAQVESWIRAWRRATGIDPSSTWCSKRLGGFPPESILWPPAPDEGEAGAFLDHPIRPAMPSERWGPDELDDALRAGFFRPHPFQYPPWGEIEPAVLREFREEFVKSIIENYRRPSMSAETQAVDREWDAWVREHEATTLEAVCASLPRRASELRGLSDEEAWWLRGVCTRFQRDPTIGSQEDSPFAFCHVKELREKMRECSFSSENARRLTLAKLLVMRHGEALFHEAFFPSPLGKDWDTMLRALAWGLGKAPEGFSSESNPEFKEYHALWERSCQLLEGFDPSALSRIGVRRHE